MEQIKKISKDQKYYAKHREEIISRRKSRPIICENCNKTYDNSNWCKHINSKKHIRNSSPDTTEEKQ